MKRSLDNCPTVVLDWHHDQLTISEIPASPEKPRVYPMAIPTDTPNDLVAKSLKALYTKHKISPKTAIVLCHHDQTLIRLMTLPSRAGKQLAAQIRHKVAHYAVFAGTPIACTHHILSEEKTDDIPRQHALVAAMPRDTVTRITDICRLSGIGITTILPPAWPMILQLTQQIPSGFVLLLEKKSTLLFQVHRGQATHLQALPVGTDSDWHSVQTECQHHITALYQRVSPLPETLHIYSDKTEWKEDLLTLTAQPACTWIETSPGLGYSSYATHASGKNGNLAESLPLPQYKKLWIRFLSYITGICILLLLLFFVLYNLNQSVQKRITHVEKDLADMQAQYQEVTDITRKINMTKSLITGRREFIKLRQNFDWQLYFRELPTMITRNLKIESINGHADGYLYLEGKALSAEDVFAFLRQLKNTSYLEKVQLQEVMQEKESGMVRFSIKSKRISL